MQFHPNKVLELYLELPHDKYIEVQNYLEDFVHPKYIFDILTQYRHLCPPRRCQYNSL